MFTVFTKDPDAVLDYEIDWSSWLDADTIASSSWSASDGITVDVKAPTFTDTATLVWVSDGTVGGYYEVTNHIVTTAGRENDRTFRVKIKEL